MSTSLQIFAYWVGETTLPIVPVGEYIFYSNFGCLFHLRPSTFLVCCTSLRTNVCHERGCTFSFCKRAACTTQREVSFVWKLCSCAAKVVAYMLQSSAQHLFDPDQIVVECGSISMQPSCIFLLRIFVTSVARVVMKIGSFLLYSRRPAW